MNPRFSASQLPRGSIIILTIIGIIAILLSVLSFQYYSFTSSKIAEMATTDIKQNAEIQGHDLSNLLESKLDKVKGILQTLATSPSIQNNELQRSMEMINLRQESTSDLTEFYFWLDEDGKVIWSSAFQNNEAVQQQFQGADLSSREYFTEPKETLKNFYVSDLATFDGTPRVFLSMPIINPEEEGPAAFKGVMVGAIQSSTIGDFLKQEIFPGSESRVSLMDNDGIVLYTRTEELRGKSIFSEEIQSRLTVIAPDKMNEVNNILRGSLEGDTGSENIISRGEALTVAYYPVALDGQHLLTVLIIAPHTLESDVTFLIDQQRTFSTMLVMVIGAIAFGIAFLVLMWNRRLERVVKARTGELQESNKQLAQANKQLQLHDRMQREFINVAAHELRTPTQAILGFSDLFYMKPDSREEAIQAITRNALRLERLANDILDVTKIEGHKLELNKEEFNLNEVIQAALEDAKRQVPNGDIEFVSEFKMGYLIVEADKARITQVISNLLNNAIKFTKQGRISVTTDTRYNEAIVSVQDTGTGIHQEVLPRLFTKFTSKSQTGTGLGLFISKSIIEAHGGTIRAENNPEGKGATFSFSLPITAPAIHDTHKNQQQMA